MTYTSYPMKGTGGLTVGTWSEVFEAESGIVNDYTGNSLSLTRIDAGDIARIGVGQVRVGGYILEVTSNHDLTVPTPAGTYHIWACYDPSLNVPSPGAAAIPPGHCFLGVSSGAPSTSGGKVYTLLYQIVRSASQALTLATVREFRVWSGPALHIPNANAIPSELLTDPEAGVTGFTFPVGSQLVRGSSERYTHLKSTSGLRWAPETGTLPDQQRFETAGTFTYTKPEGARFLHVQVQAGGGAGGGCPTTGSTESSAGSGGEGGGYVESIINASSVAATVSVTVGIGGPGSSGGGGGVGGTSSFGSHASATGGDGGTASAASGSPVATSGGNSTQVLVGQLKRPGGNGGALIRLGTGQGGVGGMGGDSALGNGGGGRGGDNAGLPGKAYGGGGGGAANTGGQSQKAGGDGAPGAVIVTTYF